MTGELSHLDDAGRARMVEVGGKPDTQREARASARVVMQPSTWQLLSEGSLPKGDAWPVVRLAGIMGAKKTPELIPLCHPIALTGVEIEIRHLTPGVLELEALVRCQGKTGVEMEALTAAAVAALALYDMVKAVDREVVIGPIRLLEKSGGRSGHWTRKEEG
ncbi:MAG: cyclic pyranopterin monophosphate synthase MoaC [Armatimonadetes bacterium]|nr:cyclic pyranopterin monophosphate synthase MoaC [Armatimonadota bacterium]